ncbi:replication-associated recombination protein A [Alkaliphilus peptidifermentans]|uniref:Replication-associated recombination protein A n=1 Tax=Alkaliphilus peptidifermentans DSM 18978 TaxID=1120976 RepID=A0A1G5H2G1_9FIRM|nr:replication-associated recombination protein A [Alkaliphilus peptidifermentans]SCY57966.1 putative ATPase [Alkaliphilus peptidifermentans DSM 18978]
MDLFDIAKENELENQGPLADKMRPRVLKEIVGQDHLLGTGKFLNRCLSSKRLPSIILWGPPGTGKTTVAKVIANEIDAAFFQLNAVTAGVKDIREVVEKAGNLLGMYKKKSILFIDEIHRFSKNQQDALLPHVEKGLLILIGATTENPYFQVNSALISRTTVLKLELLTDKDVKLLIKRAISDVDRGLGTYNIEITDEAIDHISSTSGGDARRALNALEISVLSTSLDKDMKICIDLDIAQESIQKRAVLYDKDGDQHYDVISAFIKSIRGSDPNAALHYLAKMIYGGEDPEFIARRLIISASEDIGNADPNALQIAISAHEAIKIIGMPEGRIPLAQATTYLATAPKSNAAYMGINNALRDVEKTHATVPIHLRDASYRGAKSFGHGDGYLYPHDYKNNYIKQQYLPDELLDREYYYITENGYEKKIKKHMNSIKEDL